MLLIFVIIHIIINIIFINSIYHFYTYYSYHFHEIKLGNERSRVTLGKMTKEMRKLK